MSLSEPAAPFAEDGQAMAGEEDFVCDASDSPLAAIEKCLDNGVGACLVVDGSRYLGRVSLDELGRAASARASTRLIDAETPRCAASGKDRMVRRQRGHRRSSPSFQASPTASAGRSCFSRRLRPTTQSDAPASRAARIRPSE